MLYLHVSVGSDSPAWPGGFDDADTILKFGGPL
jgi:hypothetical protein